MKSRLIITVGTLLFGASLTKAGMTWEEWTPENGIVDGQAALQEMLEAGKMPDENWQEKAQTFINAFEKLKLQLQFFWRSQVGEGATSGWAWNGISNGLECSGKKGYIKRDCPIILHFWLNGHIGKYVKKVSDYNIETYAFHVENCVPISAMFSEKKFEKTKGKLKKHVLGLFKERDLKTCAIFLNQNFCKPISNLIIKVAEMLKTKGDLQKQDLEVLFQLYGVYDCIDVFEFPIVAQENYNRTTDVICTFVADCCYDMSVLNPECKVWVINLFKNYNKDPYLEGAGIGQYNLNLTDIIRKFISKLKMEPKSLDEEFEKIMSVVIEEWQQYLKKVERSEKNSEMLYAWNQICASLHNAIYNY